MAKKGKLSFEEAVTELEATVDRLERDEGVTLDDSIALFTRGVELARSCSAILDEAEGRIVKLVEREAQAGGEPGAFAAGGQRPSDDSRPADGAGPAGFGAFTEEKF